MFLFRAEEEFNECGTDVEQIYCQQYVVQKETSCTYIIKTGRGLKRIYKTCMGYAQKTRKEAVEALIQRRRTQVRWFKAKIKWSEQAIEAAQIKLTEMNDEQD